MKFALARVEQWNLGLSASAVAASLALGTPHFATSLAAGAFLEALNLGALRRSALQFFAGQMTRSWTGAFALRFLALSAAIFLTLEAGANPIALLIGLSIAMPAVLIDAWLNRPPILDPATLPVFLDDEALDAESAAASHDDGTAQPDARMGGLRLTGELFPTRITTRFPSDALPDPQPSTQAALHPVAPSSAPPGTTTDETNR